MSDLFPHTLTIDASGAIFGPEDVEADGKRALVAGDPATFTDQQLRSVFQVIDDTQGRNFYMLTRDPAKLAEMWPEVYGKGTYSPAYVSGGEICDPDYTPEYHRPNVIIGVHCTTQAEADRLIPELLKLSSLCRGLLVDRRGQTEEIDFSAIPISKDTTANVLSGVYTLTCDEGVDHPGARQEFDGGPRIDLVISGGIERVGNAPDQE